MTHARRRSKLLVGTVELTNIAEVDDVTLFAEALDGVLGRDADEDRWAEADGLARTYSVETDLGDGCLRIYRVVFDDE